MKNNSMCINLEDSDFEKPIYRIIPIDRLIDMFRNKELILPQVKIWEDVYENFFLKSKFREADGKTFTIDDDFEEYYGQCWSFAKDSDALWRIYSPNKQGVQIKTTVNKLLDMFMTSSLVTADGGYGLSLDTKIGKVKYLNQTEMIKWIEEDGLDMFDIQPHISKSLFVKRLEFKHEEELRIIYFADSKLDNRVKSKTKLAVFEINPHDFIEGVSFDPRVDQSFIDAYKHYLHDDLKYPKIKIRKSDLYEFEPYTFKVK